ncbi:MAG: efflux RND transporter periplasmic adaptor subunit [bacterium]|nr:efflux RND transporter periplasmic adaptor subunit [bacterium]
MNQETQSIQPKSIFHFILRFKWLVGVSIALAIFIVWYFIAKSNINPSLVAYSKRGELSIEITETGVLRAVQSASVVAPKSQVNLQIVSIIPEGTTVKVGDVLIQFDPTEIQKRIDDKIAELEIARANLQKFRSEMIANQAKQKADYELAEAQFQQAKLRLQQIEFEAEIKKEEERLAMRQAEITFEQAKERIRAQAISDSAEYRTLELKVEQAQREYEKALEDLNSLTITAKQPGLVVYQEIWKGSSMGKVQVGDQPWRGQALLEIPDLSAMEVKIEVSEVDVAKIAVGNPAYIVLDAFPETKYPGKVKEVSVLARKRENDQEVKVFDVIVSIDSTSNLMKPGMTTTVTILSQVLKDVVYVPIDAIETDTAAYVTYLGKFGPKKQLVKLGPRNDNFVVIQNGLSEGKKVLLFAKGQPKEKESQEIKPNPESQIIR